MVLRLRYFILKTVDSKQARKHLAHYLDIAQKESIIITRYGKPVAVVEGVRGEDIAGVVVRLSEEENAEARKVVRKKVS
jgi:prevent-host-death family protein